MKKLKLILPMLAFICAIGMASATVDLKPEPNIQAQDYVLIDGSWEAIPEQNCTAGEYTCQVQFGQGGPVYEVYDEMDDEEPKASPSRDPKVINL